MSQIYRGDPDLVHIQDGQRARAGAILAVKLDDLIRDQSPNGDDLSKPLCPGCYMVAIFNCAIAVARANGQSLTELGNSLGNAFLALAQDGDHAESIESIEVQLDSDPCPVQE